MLFSGLGRTEAFFRNFNKFHSINHFQKISKYSAKSLNTYQLVLESMRPTCVRKRKKWQYSRRADWRSTFQVVHPSFFKTEIYRSTARDCLILLVLSIYFYFKEAGFHINEVFPLKKKLEIGHIFQCCHFTFIWLML